MPVKRLPLLQLGGEESFCLYQSVFDQLYGVDDIYDAKNRLVYFPPNMCRHVCFHEDESASDPAIRCLWDQTRAESLEWAYTALTDPDEIRPNHQFRGNEAYLLEVLPDQIVAKYPTYYYVSVRPEPKKDRVVFLTGYPVPYSYWKAARRDNTPIYRRPRR